MEGSNQKGKNNNDDITREQFKEKCDEIRSRINELAEIKNNLLNALCNGSIQGSEITKTWEDYANVYSALRKLEDAERKLTDVFCAQAIKRAKEAEKRLKQYLYPGSPSGNDENNELLL